MVGASGGRPGCAPPTRPARNADVSASPTESSSSPQGSLRCPGSGASPHLAARPPRKLNPDIVSRPAEASPDHHPDAEETMEHDRTSPVVLPPGIRAVFARVEGDIPEPMRSVSRAPLDHEERLIKETLLRMASLIEERIRLTVDALETHDAALALSVIEGDVEINAMQAEALDHIVRAIATQAPVARDLRYLLTLDHIAYELERIGDSIANVAKRVRDVAPYPPLAEYVGIPEMGRLASRILADVGRALVDSDAGAARAVASQDDAIDAHYHRAVDELIRQGQADPANVERAARLLIAAHYMERIGDRVTNIAEDVVFLATGEHEDLNPWSSDVWATDRPRAGRRDGGAG